MRASWRGIQFKGPIPKLAKGDRVQVETLETKDRLAAFFALAEVVGIGEVGITVQYCSGFSEKGGHKVPKWEYEDIRWADVARFQKFAA